MTVVNTGNVGERRALDANGAPISGAKMFVHEDGTTTQIQLYSDKALTTTVVQPLLSDAEGRFSQAFFEDEPFKLYMTDASDVAIYTADNLDANPSRRSERTFATKSGVEAARIQASVGSVETEGYSTAGDGGHGRYKRVDAEPTHDGKIRSVDRYLSTGVIDATNGGWWQLVWDSSGVRPEQFGAPHNGTDSDSAAVQSAVDCGAGRVFLSEGSWLFGDINLFQRGQIVCGENFDKTRVTPTGTNCFVVGNDEITIENIYFYPAVWDSNTQDGTTTTPCIRFKQQTATDNTITNVTIRCNRFENIAASALVIESPLRESWIHNNDFRRMGTASEGTIRGAVPASANDSANNLFIYYNKFFGGAAPFIDLRATGTPTSYSYGPIRICYNHLHGQTLDSDNNVQNVEAEQTSQIYIQDCEDTFIEGNNFESYHGDYQAIDIASIATHDNVVVADITRNKFSVDNNGTYTGNAIRVTDCLATSITHNHIKGGQHTTDILVQKALHTYTGQAIVQDNLSTNQNDIVVSLPGVDDITRQTVSDRQFTALTVDNQITLNGPVRVNNYAGTASLTSSATTLAIVFSTALANADYAISLTPNANVTAWASAASATGFTINISANAGTTAVHWMVVRH